MIHFPISGVETYWWLPALTAFCISAFTSMGGVSGAVLLLPFQVSVLGFTGPAVSPTNLLFNIIAIPSGVRRYIRERRMVWPLAWASLAGTTPGLFIGAIVRIKYLPDPRVFKLVAGLVLLYVGYQLLNSLRQRDSAPAGGRFEVTESRFGPSHISYRFNDVAYRVSTLIWFPFTAIVGCVSGIYGIGGGAIIAPFLVAVFGLPVHSIAGVALFGTLMSSVVGVMVFTFIAPFLGESGVGVMPDWALGGMFGIGGALGMYAGARMQRYVPARLIKIILVVAVLTIALMYIIGYYR